MFIGELSEINSGIIAHSSLWQAVAVLFLPMIFVDKPVSDSSLSLDEALVLLSLVFRCRVLDVWSFVSLAGQTKEGG